MSSIHLKQMPYTTRGSYLVLSELEANYQGRSNVAGYYLRTIHKSAMTPLVARITWIGGQAEDAWQPTLEQTALVLSQGDKRVECCFADEKTLLIRGGADTGVILDFLTESGPYDFILQETVEGRDLYTANCFKNNCRYLMWAQEGACQLDQRWEESSALYSRLQVGGENGFLLVMQEVETEWKRPLPTYDFEAARASMEADFSAFYGRMPALAPRYAEMGRMAAYLLWSSLVRPVGFLKREAMYMSKNWMTNVWSWDHCFNAMALAYGNPALAWDSYILMADFQDESGRLPDSVSDSQIIWNYCKPPIHGWALRWMMRHMQLSEEQQREAYAFLSQWTRWWMTYRRIDGLYYYTHGNDSGWDNATAFSVQPPIATPELQAYMIVQMQVLSDLAQRLGDDEASRAWQREAEAHRSVMLEKCFRDKLPVALQCSTGRVVENHSLLPYEALVLGEQLPEDIRRAMISVLKSNCFRTNHGFATESPKSPCYRADGYWRGPIWAPSTMLLVDGLARCGEEALARETARQFVEMVCEHGFAENFDAQTGVGLRDLAYTWTASVAVVLAKEYLS